MKSPTLWSLDQKIVWSTMEHKYIIFLFKDCSKFWIKSQCWTSQLIFFTRNSPIMRLLVVPLSLSTPWWQDTNFFLKMSSTQKAFSSDKSHITILCTETLFQMLPEKEYVKKLPKLNSNSRHNNGKMEGILILVWEQYINKERWIMPKI